jgi:hypothetical protein
MTTFADLNNDVLLQILQKLPGNQAVKAMITFGKTTYENMCDNELKLFKQKYLNIPSAEKIASDTKAFMMREEAKISLVRVDPFAYADDMLEEEENESIPSFRISSKLQDGSVGLVSVTFPNMVCDVVCQTIMTVDKMWFGKLIVKQNHTYELYLRTTEKIGNIEALSILTCIGTLLTSEQETWANATVSREISIQNTKMLLNEWKSVLQITIPAFEKLVYVHNGHTKSIFNILARCREPVKIV